MGLKDVHTVNFDFCVLGMKTGHPGSGKEGPVKKRTRVLTNSGHIYAALGKAQCSGRHTHIQLDGGKAKACEVYAD